VAWRPKSSHRIPESRRWALNEKTHAS